MTYNEKFNSDLAAIIKLIDENRIDGQGGALEKFNEHVIEVANIGKFSIGNWNIKWRKSVYLLGEKFIDINPIDFLKILTAAKEGLDKDRQEVLDFYYSEIEANSLPEETSTKRIELFVQKYPYNPEFRHTYGHFYKKKKQYEKANEQYRFALEKDKTNHTFLESVFGSYFDYLETFIDNSEYDKGLKICEDLLTENLFKDNSFYRNYIFSFKERFKDYILLNKKILDAEVKIKEIVTAETNKGQLKIIEILGFFTAIIAFVFSTVTVGKNFDFKEAIVFNISLGVTLITFALVISLLFSNKEVKLLDYRIVILVIMILGLLTIIGSNYWL